MLDEIGITYKEVEKGLFTCEGPQACSKPIAAACDASVKILNMTKFDDVVHKNGRVAGIVINWTPVSALPCAITCVDPVSLESKVVIDATDHDAHVCRSLERRGLLKLKDFGPIDVNSSEGQVVEKTGERYPGLIVTGMTASSAYGIPRIGPTFAGMFFSGRKAAIEAEKILRSERITEPALAG